METVKSEKVLEIAFLKVLQGFIPAAACEIKDTSFEQVSSSVGSSDTKANLLEQGLGTT